MTIDATNLKGANRHVLAAASPAGLAEVRDRILEGLGDPPGGGSVEEVSIYEDFQEAALKLREASIGWTEAYPTMEYRHGPSSIAAPGRVVVGDR